jgi:uncharacterized protein YaaQ
MMQNFRSSEEILSEMKRKKTLKTGNPADSSDREHGSVRRLMLVVVQTQDLRRATSALHKVGIFLTRLPSTGGFLVRRNTTLLIGLAEDQEELAVSLIHENCRQRVEYVSTPLEGAPLPIPVATPITVGGATVFTLDVERFEEF